jgi:hypothetical protein
MQGQTPQYSAMGGQLRAQAFGETGVGAQVRHDFGFQGNTVYGDVGAGAGVYAQGGGHAALGGRNLGVEGTVQGINGSTAQAGAQAQAGLGPDGITLHGSASGSALLGATVSGDAVFRSRYLDIGGGAGLTAGLAAKGEVGGGINNGTLGLNARLGGALGIGGEVGFEAGIHVGRIYGDIGYAAGVVRDTIGPEPITIEELDRRFPDGFIQP